jgi:RNA polymerase sigma factor (sigma-70 family)
MNRHQVIEQLPGLRRYARALTGNAWEADDLVQDTLERACAKWALWQTGTDLRAWLFTVMHNLYLNQRRTSASQGEADELDEEHPAPPVHTDERLDLQKALLQLPADQRALLLMVTLEDMTYEAAAKVLGIPVGTVMSRLSRARQRLRQWMSAPHADAAATSAPAPLRRLK